MAMIKPTTLVPPFNSGRKVSENDWFKMFPDTPKQNYESDKEYKSRINKKQEIVSENDSISV